MMKWRNPLKLGKRLRDDVDAAATEKASAEENHEAALERLKAAEDLADRLGHMNRRNHYSESLTEAFRTGRTA